MNIYITSTDPVSCAQSLDDARLNRMISQTASILATAAAKSGVPLEALPTKADKPMRTKENREHMCVIWAASHRVNYKWLLNHLRALIDERFFRTGKLSPVSQSIARIDACASFIPEGQYKGRFPNLSLLPWLFDVPFAYRLTLTYDWVHSPKEPKWTNREPPDWYNHEAAYMARDLIGKDKWLGIRLSKAKRDEVLNSLNKEKS